jgi:hypothetical protein
MSKALKISTFALMAILIACKGTGAEERAELYTMVDELCSGCDIVAIGGRCELDADRLADAGERLVDASWEDLRHESDGLAKMNLVRREVEAAEAMAYSCFRQRFLEVGSPGRLWPALHAAIKLPDDGLRGPAIFALLSERAREHAAAEAATLHDHRGPDDGTPISIELAQKYLAAGGFLAQEGIDRYHLESVHSAEDRATLTIKHRTRPTIDLQAVRENGKWKLELSKDLFGYRPPGST